MTPFDRAVLKAFKDPTEPQLRFIHANTRYVGYGGARGGGKSHIMRLKSLLLVAKYPGIKILVIRRTYKMLVRNFVRPMDQAFVWFPKDDRPRYSTDEKCYFFPNGSTIELGYCDNDSDLNEYIGNEWDVLFLDEATHLSETQIKSLDSCVRGTNNFPKRTYMTCNPGNQGHAYVKRLFIDKDYKRGERKRDYTFVPARVWDNVPMLMADPEFAAEVKSEMRKAKLSEPSEEIIKKCLPFSAYYRMLDSMPEDIREAWINGDWDIFAGQFFPEFDKRVHVCEPFKLDSNCHRAVAIDYGLDRLAVLWFATDVTGTTYLYRNYEEKDVRVPDAARRIKELTKESVEYYIGPPDLWSRNRDTGKSTAQTWAEYGVPMVKANNNREHGWLQVKECFNYKKDERGYPLTKPKLQIFSTCLPIIRDIPNLQHDEKKVNDVASSGSHHKYTHNPDALRYYCAMWQDVPETEVEPEPDPFHLNEPKEDDSMEGFLLGGYIC